MRAMFILCFLTLATSLSATSNLPVKRLALFVGANQGGSAQQPLLYAQRDAVKMQQVMQEVGGVASADLILLLDPSPVEVQEALLTLGARLNVSDTPSNRRTEFLFYYSGHSNELGLLLGDRSLSYKELRDGLQKVPADVRIAILDSCSSGAFARLKGGVQRAPFLGQDSSQMKGHAFLTSSSETEASQESDTLQGSFFTHYLVSGLRGGADRAGDGLITLNEAYEYAFQNTLARTESTRAGPQHPSYEIQLTGTGNLILSDTKTSNARLIVAPDVSGKLYVRNLAGQLYAEVNKDPGATLSLAFPSGTYSVTIVTTKKSLSSRVVLNPQGTSTLATRDFQEQDLARFAIRGPSPETVAEPDPSVEVDFVPFSLGLVPGLSSTGLGGIDKSLSLAALVDFAGGVRGLQAAGLISLNAHTIDGMQTSGVGSISRGPIKGAQSAGIFSIAAEGIQGVQSAGVFSLAGGLENGFLQASGVFNLSRGTFRGVQAAGIMNVADGIEGVQSAGIVNVAGEVKGLQIGLVNINRHIEGAGVGLVFISPDAYYRPMALWDDRGRTHALFQWGMGGLYWLLGVIADTKTASITQAWEQLDGAGFHWEAGAFFWDNDAGWSSSFVQDQSYSGRPYLRSSLGVQAGWVAIEAGLLATFEGGGSSVTLGPWEIQTQNRWFVGLRLF